MAAAPLHELQQVQNSYNPAQGKAVNPNLHLITPKFENSDNQLCNTNKTAKFQFKNPTKLPNLSYFGPDLDPNSKAVDQKSTLTAPTVSDTPLNPMLPLSLPKIPNSNPLITNPVRSVAPTLPMHQTVLDDELCTLNTAWLG